jgi:hypothetical protein
MVSTRGTKRSSLAPPAPSSAPAPAAASKKAPKKKKAPTKQPEAAPTLDVKPPEPNAKPSSSDTAPPTASSAKPPPQSHTSAEWEVIYAKLSAANCLDCGTAKGYGIFTTDPRHSKGFAGLPIEEKGAQLINFQKVVVANCLADFQAKKNPIGWMSNYLGLGVKGTALSKLEGLDYPRYAVLIDLCALSVAQKDLASAEGSYWFKYAFAGDPSDDKWDAMSYSSFRGEFYSACSYFGDPEATDADQFDVSDEMLKQFISEMSYDRVTWEGKTKTTTRVVVKRADDELVALLGTQESAECSLFGAWELDFEGTLATWLARPGEQR